MAQECDVLVVGAGPVGLMLALMLRKQGIACRIIDKMPVRQSYCKALGIQPRTLEIWDDMGIINPMINQGLCFKGNRVFQDGQEMDATQVSLPELPFGFLSLPQCNLEDILVNEVQEIGIVVEQGVELVSFEQSAQAVAAVVINNHSGDSETVHARYLIACDGAHSLVRKLLGIAFEGGKFPQYFMLADVRVSWDYDHPVVYRFGYHDDDFENTVVFVPYRGDRRFRISTTVPESMRSSMIDGKPTLEHFAEILEKAVPISVKLDDLRWSSMYQISHRIVERYSSGRVFLAGDAAHIHPPVGGQGLNTGIQDVYNLAWKITLVLKGRANAELLDSYHEERHPVGMDVVNRTYHRMQAKQDADSDAHYALLVNSQTLINYRDNRLSKGQALSDKVCKPGDRAPDVSMLKRDIFNFPVRLFEVLRGHKFNLLVYTDSEAVLGVAESVQHLLGVFMDTSLIAPPGFQPENSTLPLLTDLNNDFKAIYQMKTGSACLIRPDNYIAWRSEQLNEQDLLAWFSRNGFYE